MEQYIPKAALVAEIERLKDNARMSYSEYADGRLDICKELLSIIDTLEVKDFWKSADGDDLPEIDREVIALLDNCKVVFAHRPPEYWDGKNITTGEVEHYTPKTYDKGGWNIPDVKYWLNVKFPKEIKL